MSLRSLDQTTRIQATVIERSSTTAILLLVLLLLNTLGSATMLACETSCCKSPAAPAAADSVNCHEQMVAVSSADARLFHTHSTNPSTPERLLQCASDAQSAMSLQQERTLASWELVLSSDESNLAPANKRGILASLPYVSPPALSSQVSSPLRT